MNRKKAEARTMCFIDHDNLVFQIESKGFSGALLQQ
jgi:hypothetical protein